MGGPMKPIHDTALNLVKQYIVCNTDWEGNNDFGVDQIPPYFDVHTIIQAKAGGNWSFVFKSNLSSKLLYIVEYEDSTGQYSLKLFEQKDKVLYTTFNSCKGEAEWPD